MQRPFLCCLEDLKSLTRYRFRKVQEQSKLKLSLSRLVTILFPELESAVSTIHLNSIYSMLLKYPSAKDIAKSTFSKLANLLEVTSKGKFDREKAKEIRNLARKSVGIYIPAKAMELRQTIELIQVLDANIAEIEAQIETKMQEIDSPITTIKGIGTMTAAVIHAEVGDFERLSPSTYQSGKFVSQHAKLDKRGSKYLRHTLFEAAKHVSRWSPTFAAYLKKKRSEGKHYYSAVCHVAKKLIRVIFHLQKTGEEFQICA